MLTINKKSLAFAIVASSIAFTGSAFAGSLTQTSNTWMPGYEFKEDAKHFERTIHVDQDTGYKSGSAYIIKTTISRQAFDGARADENGFERVEVIFDPSQVATASDGNDNMMPKTLNHAAPNYFLDDSDYKYHLSK